MTPRDPHSAPTGYGSGCREPKARGAWARFKQLGREPVTTTDISVMFAIVLVVSAAILVATA